MCSDLLFYQPPPPIGALPSLELTQLDESMLNRKPLQPFSTKTKHAIRVHPALIKKIKLVKIGFLDKVFQSQTFCFISPIKTISPSSQFRRKQKVQMHSTKIVFENRFFFHNFICNTEKVNNKKSFCSTKIMKTLINSKQKNGSLIF